MSPVAITFDAREIDIRVGVGVRAARMLHDSRLALDHQPLAFGRVGLLRDPILLRRLGLLTVTAHWSIRAARRSAKFRCATTVAPSLAKPPLPPVWSPWKCVLITYLIGLPPDRAVDLGFDLVVKRRELGVDLDDRVAADGDDHVTALAFQHVGVVAERRRLDLNLRKVRLTLRERGRCEQACGCNGCGECKLHWNPSLNPELSW